MKIIVEGNLGRNNECKHLTNHPKNQTGFFQMNASDVIRGHRMTDKEANEMIWREIDQAFLAIEPIPLEVVKETLRQEIEKLYIIKANLKENKNERFNNSR